MLLASAAALAQAPSVPQAKNAAANPHQVRESAARKSPANAASPSQAPAASSSGIATQTPEIVVTAERRSERLQDTPVAVSAFTTKALEQRGVTNLGEIAHFTPSLQIHATNRPGGGGSSIAAYIRGVGTGDYNIPSDPGIGIYVDGVYLARSVGALMSLTDIERIEVLKGPQGTLYGRNTIGGAISIITEQPELSGDPKIMAEARLGTHRRIDGLASINTPIVNDKIGFKLSVADLNERGYGRDLFDGTSRGDEDRFVTRGALRVKFADDVDLTIDADYSRQRNNGPASSVLRYFPGSPLVGLYNGLVAPTYNMSLGLPAGSGLNSQYLPVSKYDTYAAQAPNQSPLRDNFDNGGVSATLAYTPSPAFHVKSITAFRKLKAAITVDGDQTPYPVVADQTFMRDQQFSQEVQIGGKVLNDRLTYLAGGYFFREVGNTDEYLEIFHGLYQATGDPGLALDSRTFQHLRETSYAAFTQETLTVVPGLNLTAGIRVNRDDKDYDAYVLKPQLGTVAIPDQASSPGWTSVTKKFGIDYKPNADLMLYASYADGFKSGGISPPIAGLAPATYDPEKLDTYEAGLKSQWFDRRLTANFAAYYSDYHDIQLTSIVTLPNGSFGKPVQNGGTAHIYGFEGELTAVPAPGLTLNASAAYTHARFASLSAGAQAALCPDVTYCRRLPQIPDYNASIGAQYEVPLAIGDVTLRGDASRIGKTQLTIGDPSSFQSAYTLVDARLAFAPVALPGLTVALVGTNLTNKLYFIYSQSQATSGQQAVEPGAPREVMVDLKYRF